MEKTMHYQNAPLTLDQFMVKVIETVRIMSDDPKRRVCCDKIAEEYKLYVSGKSCLHECASAISFDTDYWEGTGTFAIPDSHER